MHVLLLPTSATGAVECRPDPLSCDRMNVGACLISTDLAFKCPVKCGQRTNCSSSEPDTPPSAGTGGARVTSTAQATRMPNNTGTLNPWLHAPRLYENNTRPLVRPLLALCDVTIDWWYAPVAP